MRTIQIYNELILVEVSKDAVNFELGNNLLYGSTLFYKINNAKYSGPDVIKGNFEIIGLIETPNLNFNFDANNIKIPCTVSCSPSDFRKGGKCDKNGCLGDNNSLLKTRIQRKIQDAGIELTGNLLLIKKLK